MAADDPHVVTKPSHLIIVDYDPRWPALYEAEHARLRRALVRVPAAIHHMGSTAVPGLAAKPVIDILIEMPSTPHRGAATGRSCDVHDCLQYACAMVMVQIRGVAAKAHRRLKARAALEGKSLSEYLRTEIEELAELPTIEEMAQRIATRSPVRGASGAEAIGAARRERQLERH